MTAEPNRPSVIPFTSAHVACQICPSLLISARASTAPKIHHGLDIGEPVVHFLHWTAHARIAQLTLHPCYQSRRAVVVVGASRWGTPQPSLLSAAAARPRPSSQTQTQTKPRTDQRTRQPCESPNRSRTAVIPESPPSPFPNRQPPPWICSIQDIAMAENKMQLEDCAFGPRLRLPGWIARSRPAELADSYRTRAGRPLRPFHHPPPAGGPLVRRANLFPS